MTHTVLLVDDDVALTDALRRSLRNENFTLLASDSAEAALDMLSREKIDIVVSDEQMPGMGGLELLANVRAMYPEIVTIMLSGHASIGTVVNALNHGQIFRFLIKPCLANEVGQAIRQALTHKTVLDRCCMLLPLFRRNLSLLREIERLHPGLIADTEASLEGRRTPAKIDIATVEAVSESIDIEIRQAARSNIT